MTPGKNAAASSGPPVEPPDPARLQDALGHRFRDLGLLAQALTHSSAAADRRDSNERLEFLGDRVLGLVVAGMLLDAFPDEDEGALGYRFSALVRRETLARVAGDVGLAPFVRLAAAEDVQGERENAAILANCMEAVIAAVYRDGGLDAAGDVIRRRWQGLLAEEPHPPKDAKTMLQEWAQARGLAKPEYALAGRRGPDHAPVFTIEVTLHEIMPVRAEGPNKQAAEQAAARALLARIGAGE